MAELRQLWAHQGQKFLYFLPVLRFCIFQFKISNSQERDSDIGIKTWPARVCLYQLQFPRRGCHYEQDPRDPILFQSAFLFFSLPCDLQPWNVSPNQPCLCEIRSVIAPLTEGQIQENITQTHKSGEIKSRREVKRLGESESQCCNIEAEKMVGISVACLRRGTGVNCLQFPFRSSGSSTEVPIYG